MGKNGGKWGIYLMGNRENRLGNSPFFPIGSPPPPGAVEKKKKSKKNLKKIRKKIKKIVPVPIYVFVDSEQKAEFKAKIKPCSHQLNCMKFLL